MRAGIDDQALEQRPGVVQRACVNANASGSAIHSACQGPVARSWSCTIASSMTGTSWRTFLAQARMNSQAIGLRFCGMVLLPPRPS